MGYRIEYGYRVGDVQTYIQTVTLVTQEPGGPKTGGRSEIESTTRVIGEQAGVFTLQLQVRVLKREGVMDVGQLPDAPAITYTSDRSGCMLSCDSPGLPQRMEAFPKQEMEVGASWKGQDRTNPIQPIDITHLLESVEPSADGICACIVSQAVSQVSPEGLQTRVQASQVFDLTHGYQKESTTVTHMAWLNGKTTDVVVENRLVSRSPSAKRSNRERRG